MDERTGAIQNHASIYKQIKNLHTSIKTKFYLHANFQ